ncbi:MAG: hypothetical protein KKF10_08965, partial [Verrucomicrobia bacterium]|nr:hypothetical protein [Verrucomicrobiota bacterium]
TDVVSGVITKNLTHATHGKTCHQAKNREKLISDSPPTLSALFSRSHRASGFRGQQKWAWFTV